MSAGCGCPCEALRVHPRIIANPPGLTSIAYRVGDYDSFRAALLRPRPGERALAPWRPAEGSDLGLQLLEWWAYLADILTFYNERALELALLRTASEDVRRVVRLLGYRPRPGIGATGVVAARTDAVRPFLVPRGLAVQGAAPAGAPGAQIFEVDEDVRVGVLGRPSAAWARLLFPPTPGRTGSTDGQSGSWSEGQGLTDAAGKLLDAVPTRPPPNLVPIERTRPATFALDGVVTTIQPGDLLLLLPRDWDGGEAGKAIFHVRTTQPLWDLPSGAVTVVGGISAQDLSAAALTDCKVLRPTKLAHLWTYHERYKGSDDPSQVGSGVALQVLEQVLDPGHVFTSGASTEPPKDARVLTGRWLDDTSLGIARLEGITRGIVPGDPVLVESKALGGISAAFEKIAALADQLPAALDVLQTMLLPSAQLLKVVGYAEDIWYANAPESDRIGQGPPVGPPGHSLLGNAPSPIPIPHSRIMFRAEQSGLLDTMRESGIREVVVHYGWQEVSRLVETPATEGVDSVETLAAFVVPPTAAVPVLVQDATGQGTTGWLGETITCPPDLVSGRRPKLFPPVQALLHLLPISRGATVDPEVLGSGDPTLAGQEFALRRGPLTYLADPDPRWPGGYRSTLEIRVDGITWQEVESFYDQPPDARVFVTREDEDQKTHVRFGDGLNGARLPAGAGNVIARYRVGSGEAVPPIGSLTAILRPQPGLRAIENPVAPAGGSDPDAPDRIRDLAPRSVLTFGRAVSRDDYEVIAAQTPGVRRACASWAWDAAAQRNTVTVHVGDDAAAVAAATAALRAVGAPNLPVTVLQALPAHPDLSLTVEVEPARDLDAVRSAVVEMLLDPRNPLFGAEVVRIGQVIYDSQIHDACLAVPGVVAVHGLLFRTTRTPLGAWPGLTQPGARPVDLPGSIPVLHGARPAGIFGRRPMRPGPGPVLSASRGERHAPAPGTFFLLRADQLHVSAEVARRD